MKYTFKYEDSDNTKSSIEFEAVTLDEIISEFKRFLYSVGFNCDSVDDYLRSCNDN